MSVAIVVAGIVVAGERGVVIVVDGIVVGVTRATPEILGHLVCRVGLRLRGTCMA